ncbi:MAG: NADH-quinone oxidoreductase subunit L [Bacillota bacterium]|jgi:NADH:ubiquinone oxidoreductase subunit 5 (subunit L)/multisubunit Na+/H+ antiporter MnhA subunit
MDAQGILLICIFVPIVGAFFLPAVGKVSVFMRNILALIFVGVSFASALLLLPQVLTGDEFLFYLKLPLGMSIGFLGDALAVFMALTSSLLGAFIVFYSFGYIKHYQNQNEYYMMVVLFIGAMMGLVFSTNLIFIYLFWEISAICCWRLIAFFRKKEIVIRANKAFLITVAGSLVMLLGFIAIYAETGTFDLLALHGLLLPNFIVLFIMFGILTKSATFPFHSWLPDAGVAPSPVTSLLHAAVLVKIGVYMFARLFLVNFEIEIIWSEIIPILAAVSALVSAGAALIENDLKRIIAYSTVSQLSFILLGLSCGSALGAAGAMLYILMHGLAKGGLFLCAGVVEQATHTKDIRELGGLIHNMPKTALSFAICAFSVMGLPPLGGFFAKYMVIGGAVVADQPWIAFVFVVGAIMTIAYLARVFVKVFFGPVKYPTLKETSIPMIFSVVSLAVLSIVAGIFVKIPAELVDVIMISMGW